MPERKKTITAWAAAGAVALGGVGVGSWRISEALDDSKSMPTISIKTMPDKLPPAVAKQADTALAVEAVGSPIGSGVIIDNTLALTARHVTKADLQYGTEAEVKNSCDYYNFNGRTEKGNFIEGFAKRGGEAASEDDISLLEVPFSTWGINADKPLKSQTAELRTTPVNKGEVVFFINYEPDAHGNARMPRYGDKPAIYGGIVIDTRLEANHIAPTYEIVPFKNYGSGTAETYTRGGASGGQVVDSKGKLIGLSVSTIDDTVDSLEYYKDVKIPNLPKNKELQVNNIQGVTTSLITELKKDLKIDSNACHPKG